MFEIEVKRTKGNEKKKAVVGPPPNQWRGWGPIFGLVELASDNWPQQYTIHVYNTTQLWGVKTGNHSGASLREESGLFRK